MKRTIVFYLLLFIVGKLQAQQADTSRRSFQFSGSVSVTHNGLSFIPTFSLEKPAAIFNLSMGRNKARFEPELRFSLEGKPWSFLFWWRYQLLKTGRFSLKVGGHPAMNFRTQQVMLNGQLKNVIVSRRYLAGELAPVFTLSKNLTTGIYYLYSRGLDDGTTRNNHFIALHTGVSHLRLAGNWFLKLVPQFYYLKLDQQDGFFITSSFSVTKTGFPLSLGAIINKRLQSNIAGSRDFVWNTTLVYSFNQR